VVNVVASRLGNPSSILVKVVNDTFLFLHYKKIYFASFKQLSWQNIMYCLFAVLI